MLKMETLRSLCQSLGFERVQTYVQSGNVLFWCEEKEAATVARRLQRAIEKSAGFAPDVVLRTRGELELVIARNPFAERPDISPNKLLVTFFAREPERETVAKLNARQFPPEEFQLLGRELYVFFPEGAGRSKFPVAAIGKMLKESGTARNWNTVLKLFEMAGKSELSGPMHRRPTMEE
jgi:uncharacterized protein (DUF1697 family)